MPASPRFATPRSDRETLGPQVVAILRELGIEAMPWQRDHFDVSMEVDDDGHFVYREDRFSTPRQSGKSTALLGRALWTVRHVPRSVGVYTAQTGAVARDRIALEWGPSVVGDLWPGRIYKGKGSERIDFANGSKLLAVANSLSSGHGLTIDVAEHDEIFAWPDDRLRTALRPAMVTKVDAQSVLCSTMGTAESTVWHELVDDGRARCESGEFGRVCYEEFSAPDDADPYDPETWAACMPALGFTITEDVIKAEAESMSLDAFRRSYLNQRTSTELALVPPAAWRNCLDPNAAAEGSLHLGIDVAPGPEGGRATAFVIAGRGVVELVDHRPGTAWAIERLVELDLRHSFQSVSIDSYGPSRAILNEVEGVIGPRRLKIRGTSDMTAASQRLHSAILEDGVRHRGQDALDAAVKGAAKRSVGESWVFGRRVSSADVSPLVAAALAYFAMIEAGGDSDGQGIY